ncbi:RNA polymerase sigma factor [Brevundimonas kwangchunensis]|uniref:RNA polymerase sigma factor n=1 Tax=Brevundimonas kwangchunensis TaxID=322163 RepID=A0ABN1H4U3_9CAUL
MTAPAAHPLIPGYLAQRDALRRFFRARAGASADVEDLLQDLYLKVIAVDPGTEVKDLNAYLYRLASNLMMDRWRSSRRGAARDGAWREVTVTTGAGEDIADAPAADDVVIGRERLAVLLKTMEALPDKTRRIFRMHKFEGLSYAEVATRMGISRSSVEKHMMDALRILFAKVPR